IASPRWIHRFELFCLLSGCNENEAVSEVHLQRLLAAKRGYFQYSQGEKIVFFNKVERPQDQEAVAVMLNMLAGGEYLLCYGSLHRGEIQVCNG
ncbi:MAG: hypothetical protein CSA32_04300, partial [Desulfobulbus propionicus]